MQRKRLLALAMAGAVALGVPVGQAAAKDDGPATEGLAQCAKTYQSGSGNTFFKWCIHPNGTIGYLEAPVNQKQIYGDAFYICSGNNTVVHGYGLGNVNTFSSTNLTPPTYPNANTVVHRTTNGRFEIRQVFSQNAADKNIFIDVTVKNLLGSQITGVEFSRVVDFDLNNSSADDLWIRSYASVLASETNAVTLSGITWPIGRKSQIEGYHVSSDCLDTAAPSPSTGDYMGRVNYVLGTLNGGQSKTFRYRIAQL